MGATERQPLKTKLDNPDTFYHLLKENGPWVLRMIKMCGKNLGSPVVNITNLNQLKKVPILVLLG